MTEENPYQSPREVLPSKKTHNDFAAYRSLFWILFSFRGRIPRLTYWIASLGVNLTWIIVVLFGMELEYAFHSSDKQFLNICQAFGFSAISILTFTARFAIDAKRWQDRNKSIFWLLLYAIPMIGPMWTILELGFFPGTEGPNRFGPDPFDEIREDSIILLGENLAFRSTIIELDGSGARDEDLLRLANAVEIEEVRLGNTKVTDEGMKYLANLHNLKLLDLSMTAIGDRGLESLLNLPNLAELWLGGTCVTDEGLMKLAKLPRLENLFVVNTQVTPEGVERFKSLHSDCDVHY
jgi:uncharacterized membrane protein YhaH (DUF805 family)